MSYKYFEDKKYLKEARKCCSEIIRKVVAEIRKEGIKCESFLVGSGKRNMVTYRERKDGKIEIDFDYNLNIFSVDDWDDTRYIKETVQKYFNKVMRKEKLRDVSDSTSCLCTDYIHFVAFPNIEFKIDLAIVTKNDDGIWERLIHKKTVYRSCDSWIWNKVKSSDKLKGKIKELKDASLWADVREEYLKVKNSHQKNSCFDNSYTSFVCYIEAVNNVYNRKMNSSNIWDNSRLKICRN